MRVIQFTCQKSYQVVYNVFCVLCFADISASCRYDGLN